MQERPKLTKRQQEVYDFIIERIRTRGYGPTVREIGTNFEIRSPNGVMCHLQALVKKGLITREPNMSRAISVVRAQDRGRGIPLEGIIAAGHPIEAFRQDESVDFGEFFPGKTCYALKVRGNSMVDDHIEDGDYVVIKRQDTARDGQVVVALVDGAETTLKRFFKEKTRYRLEPANNGMKPIFTQNVQVLGVLVGVVRKFEPSN